ncbi:MAG: chemotaxis protein [Oceanospirillaceae bacterium]|nr:chemotaxis protein [Oceanospirillaceae bacterium]MBT10438.1 chemotaxis protein [Oceanospirillaceae bacterium]|tara:strand:- start:667 stop:2220 length:1554 start_codon:yes stop_codon:yes gene_type:complete
MRINQPVTANEVTFPPQQQLISSTDLKGKILNCNDAFISVSGFSREELLGQPHNIVRHPDMPAAAFDNMWQYLKAGRPWMGMVKNRCKNGDFYWVSAYITPLMEGDQVVGYESVRNCPSRDDVKRAEWLYKNLSAGSGRRFTIPRIPFHTLLISLLVLVSAGLGIGGWVQAAWLVMLAGSVTAAALGFRAQKRIFRVIRQGMGKSFCDDLAARTYTDDPLELGRLKVAVLSQQRHLDTILTRLRLASQEVRHSADSGLESVQGTCDALRHQLDETAGTATAVQQMSATIGEVSGHIQETARYAAQAREKSDEGHSGVTHTRQSVEDLKSKVDEIRTAVAGVAEQTGKISQATAVIEQIAEQTNLLALNAAIEAARAGEQGRGFAVVADEVRELAMRTRESTAEIYTVVSGLVTLSNQSVEVADLGAQAGDSGLQSMIATEEMLDDIAASVSQIADMSIQMAASVEEQVQVADDIAGQVARINQLAEQSMTSGNHTADDVGNIQKIAGDLYDLMVRFR